MRQVTVDQIEARVRLANYHPCQETQAWLKRTIIDLQFIYVVRGSLAYQPRNESPVLIHQDEVLCIRPTVFHDLHTAAAGTIISGIHCELSPGSWAARDYRLDPAPPLITRPDPAQGLHDLYKLCAETFSGYGNFIDARCNSICKTIMLSLAEHWSHQRDSQLSKRMQDMIDFIRQHLSEPIGRQTLAEQFYLTPEHINYVFRQEINMTPGEVINRERCMRAHQLLTDGLSVKEAAYAVGFNDPLFFSRVFRKYFQVPPSRV